MLNYEFLYKLTNSCQLCYIFFKTYVKSMTQSLILEQNLLPNVNFIIILIHLISRNGMD